MVKITDCARREDRATAEVLFEITEFKQVRESPWNTTSQVWCPHCVHSIRSAEISFGEFTLATFPPTCFHSIQVSNPRVTAKVTPAMQDTTMNDAGSSQPCVSVPYNNPMIFSFSTPVMASVTQLIGEGQPAASDPLTRRQREILRMITEGHNTKAIARLLEISPKRVESHRSAIKVRLGIDNIPGLVRYAMRTGLVGLET